MEFFTIKEMVQVELVEKKSKFIANLFPIESIKEAEDRMKQIKKKYHDARHNCIAYRVQEGGKIFEKSSDDGEPSGTAGAPMLTILQKNNLANVAVVVTRYFGGILLGTGGLVRAYSDSLLKAIENSSKIKKCEGVEILITMKYGDFDNFKYYCKNNNIFITNVEYSELISCKIELEDEKKEKLLKDFETKAIILKDIEEITKKYITKSI
ncbi:MAG: YigZ family protein [Clostridia bacterium]|nr:YigZ family protein [Clostridia bacterium]